MKLYLQLILICLAFFNAAQAETLQIVCFGGSNTFGKNLPRSDAYPAQLERMLKENGYDVAIKNAGTNGQTTSDELGKLNSEIPDGTAIVIFQPGGNDNNKRFIGDTAANIRAIVQKLRDRKIDVIFSGNQTKRDIVQTFDLLTIDEISHLAPEHLQGDGSHLTAEGYRIVAESLQPLVEKLIQQRATQIKQQ